MNALKFVGNIGQKIMSNPTVAKTALKFKKNLPTIAVITGVVGVAVAYGLVIHEATTVDDILDEHENKLNEIEEDVVDEKQKRRAVTKTYIRTGFKVAKHFAPSFLALSLGVACIGYSHISILKNNLALTAGLATLGDSFQEYRKRVTETIGEEAERKLRYGLEESIESEIEKEDGTKEKIVVYRKGDKPYLNPYARVFDESNPNYDPSHPDFNVLFLRNIQNQMNDLLQIKRYLFLNTVYEALGFDPTPDGQLMGWSYDPKNPRYFDMGIMNINNREVADFINGRSNAILLDFNVDPEPLYSKL